MYKNFSIVISVVALIISGLSLYRSIVQNNEVKELKAENLLDEANDHLGTGIGTSF